MFRVMLEAILKFADVLKEVTVCSFIRTDLVRLEKHDLPHLVYHLKISLKIFPKFQPNLIYFEFSSIQL